MYSEAGGCESAATLWMQYNQNVHCVDANFPLIIDVVLNVKIFYYLSVVLKFLLSKEEYFKLTVLFTFLIEN